MFKLFRFSIIGKGNSCDILRNLSNILAARLGATPMAAFQFCLQFWMTSSLLSDGLAIAGQLHRNRATLTDEQLEVHTISAWKERKSQQYGEAIRAAQLMFGRPLIWAGPDESLKDVALMILQNKISTVPIIYSTIEESSPLLLHIACLGGILKCGWLCQVI